MIWTSCLSVFVCVSVSLSVNTRSQKLLDRLPPNFVYIHFRSKPPMGWIFTPAGQTWPEIWGQKAPVHFKWQKYFFVDYDTEPTADHIGTYFRPTRHPWPEIWGTKAPIYFKWQKYFFVDYDTGSTTNHIGTYFRLDFTCINIHN